MEWRLREYELVNAFDRSWPTISLSIGERERAITK
jgi:hypothetical protein